MNLFKKLFGKLFPKHGAFDGNYICITGGIGTGLIFPIKSNDANSLIVGTELTSKFFKPSIFFFLEKFLFGYIPSPMEMKALGKERDGRINEQI